MDIFKASCGCLVIVVKNEGRQFKYCDKHKEELEYCTDKIRILNVDINILTYKSDLLRKEIEGDMKFWK